MEVLKVVKDHIDKWVFHRGQMPLEVKEWKKYVAVNGAVTFKFDEQEDGSWVASSTNFKYGSIITSADSKEDLDSEIKDAILTAFSIPSAYAGEAKVLNSKDLQYATVK
jgi:hypothetical protein